MPKLIDLTGQVFGRLAVVSYAGKNTGRNALWNCLCECGNEIIIRGDNLKSGATKSCGCLQIEVVTKHGYCKVGNVCPTYRSWADMVKRCTNPNTKQYKDYGDRGITVCDRWLNSFENFLEDMGEKPSKEHSIDRIDNNGNYCKENCKWSTRKEQQRNMRKNVWLTFNGETKIREEWAREWGLRASSIHQYLSKGRSMEWIYENKVRGTGSQT